MNNSRNGPEKASVPKVKIQKFIRRVKIGAKVLIEMTIVGVCVNCSAHSQFPSP